VRTTAVYRWLDEQGKPGDRDLVAALRKIWKASDPLPPASDIPGVLGLTNAQTQRLREAIKTTENEISGITTELRQAGWNHKKTSEDPGGRGVKIEWERIGSSANDAGSVVRQSSGRDYLDAYRNAKRQLLG
jgi:hypothetical protein